MRSATPNQETGPTVKKLTGVVNWLLITSFICLIIFHIVSLAIVADKNSEVVDKFNPEHQMVSSDDDFNFCIFFINDDHPNGDTRACDFVIYGSGVLAGCALLMTFYLTGKIARHRIDTELG